ncbi:ubiquitin-like-specific protease 1D isoform X1 [Ananas comosus]|uniref:Ubiquitin-like-specific protease 1D isoform X1 n=1 Tax=Ananas comosus TaxID=4615 RepID=A0A6P5GGB6_ANACO|nr:ubiquitin-like-specific protease 1D isoform X1 [Ananas comosus]XP_020106968.1 ubiquitin-like-specific protease 1D isoform X1 [Ananas comosus]XP_020106969.1 ubiquitin-like-specific protease 1D isoform X1 [Ananas comosus]
MTPFREKNRVWNLRSTRIITRQAAKMSRTSENTLPSFYDSLPQYRRAKRLRNNRVDRSSNQTKVDTNLFEAYLEDLWSRISEEKRHSCVYLDCLWFSLYKDGVAEPKILSWIKSKQIFSRKYVFVPIVCWQHWSLLILCHFGGKGRSKAAEPCMLLLDSLHTTGPKRLEPAIRRFILDIYKFEGRKETKWFISKIPLLIPKVPQQKNGEECGAFVLYFIYRFLQNAPETFKQEEYPYFLNEDWFDLKDFESFNQEMNSFRSNKEIVQIS